MRTRGARKMTLRRGAMLAVLTLATATVLLWSLGRSIERSHTAASDSQLVADLRIARAILDNDVAAAARRASALARLSRIQDALAHEDAGALRALAASHPGALLVAVDGTRGGSLPPLGIRRIVDVVSDGRSIGRVVTEAPLGATYLSRVRASLPAGAHDVLVVTRSGRVAAGPLPIGTGLSAGSPADVHVRGRGYRALGSALAKNRPEIRIVALAPRTDSFMAGWRLPLAVLATLAAVAVLAAWTSAFQRARRVRVGVRAEPGTRSSSVPGEQRASGAVALLGETPAATHDPGALLAVILDAAVTATGAVGGKLVRGSGMGSRVGESDSASLLTVPLETNEPGGSSLILFPPAYGFTAEAADVAHWLGVQASTAIKNARLHDLGDRTISDELTGLANRRHFATSLHAELARAERFATPLAVLLCDLDDFKRVSDRFGHDAADDVLKAFARALQGCVREVDLAARIEDDEFAVLLPQTDAEGARQLAARLRSEFRAEQSLPDPVTASYGISSFPNSGSVEELLISADICLHQAKEGGKDRVDPSGTEAQAS